MSITYGRCRRGSSKKLRELSQTINEEEKMKKYYHMNHLQFFAEGAEGGDQGEGAEGAKESETQETDNAEKKDKDEEKKEAKYSEEDLDRIINRKVAELASKYEKKADEAEKLAKMNAQEKAEYENKQLREELNELKSKQQKAELIAEARKMLNEAQIKNAPDELITVLVSPDAEATKKAVDAFTKMFNEAVQAAVVDKLKGSQPKGGSGNGGITKEQIMSVKNKAERQQLIKDNMELFR